MGVTGRAIAVGLVGGFVAEWGVWEGQRSALKMTFYLDCWRFLFIGAVFFVASSVLNFNEYYMADDSASRRFT